MVFISATRLRVRSVIYLPAFMRANNASVKELLKTKGLIAGKELIDKGLTFWTVTLWAADADMKSFRSSDAHRKAMQRLPDWCNEASYVHWQQEDAVVPAWNTIHEKMVTEGKMSKVRNPSARQTEKLFPSPRWSKTERVFKVKS